MTTCKKVSLPSSMVFVEESLDVITCDGLSVELVKVSISQNQLKFGTGTCWYIHNETKLF